MVPEHKAAFSPLWPRLPAAEGRAVARSMKPHPKHSPGSAVHVSDQIRSDHIISYHIISYHITSYHIISHHTISYDVKSHHIISYHIMFYVFAHTSARKHARVGGSVWDASMHTPLHNLLGSFFATTHTPCTRKRAHRCQHQISCAHEQVSKYVGSRTNLNRCLLELIVKRSTFREFWLLHACLNVCIPAHRIRI